MFHERRLIDYNALGFTSSHLTGGQSFKYFYTLGQIYKSAPVQ